VGGISEALRRESADRPRLGQEGDPNGEAMNNSQVLAKFGFFVFSQARLFPLWWCYPSLGRDATRPNARALVNTRAKRVADVIALLVSRAAEQLVERLRRLSVRRFRPRGTP